MFGCAGSNNVILYQSIHEALQTGYDACRKTGVFADDRKFLNHLGTYKFDKVPVMLHLLNLT
jgi:hypothetical protein